MIYEGDFLPYRVFVAILLFVRRLGTDGVFQEGHYNRTWKYFEPLAKVTMLDRSPKGLFVKY